MTTAPNAKCQRVLLLAVWLIFISEVADRDNDGKCTYITCTVSKQAVTDGSCYPSKTSGTTSRLPDMMNTAELNVFTVAVNTAVWMTGPKNATSDWIL